MRPEVALALSAAVPVLIEINMPADYMTSECEVGRPTDLVHAYCVPVATRWSSA
jgi:hypothetical protein